MASPARGDSGAGGAATVDAAPALATPARGERDAPPPPLDPRRVSLDVFELYCHAMLATELADVGTRDRLVAHLQVGRSEAAVARFGSTPRRASNGRRRREGTGHGHWKFRRARRCDPPRLSPCTRLPPPPPRPPR